LPFFAFLCLLDFLIEPSVETFYQVYANLTLCFGLLPAHNITVIGVGWFLGIVFLFYLLFPFFVFMLDTKKRAWGSFLVSLLFVIIAMNAEFVSGGVTRGNFIFCAPYFLAGGLIYLYRHGIFEFAKRYNILCAIVTILLTICYFAFKHLFSANLGYIAELCLFALWILFAIGTNTKLLSNRVLKYLSNISMEIYLSHMLIYRVIEKVHLEKYISQNDILYIVTSILTICGVICFAHIMKYYVMNKVEAKFIKSK
jgi:peptidoglycan/LPS O-acetylase OafA/YrhL